MSQHEAPDLTENPHATTIRLCYECGAELEVTRESIERTMRAGEPFVCSDDCRHKWNGYEEAASDAADERDHPYDPDDERSAD